MRTFAPRRPAPVDGFTGVDGLGEARRKALATLEKNLHRVSYPNVSGARWTLDAGKNHFAALWTRDSSFPALGLLAEGRTEPVRDYLDALLANMRKDGLAPRRLGAGANFFQTFPALFGIHPKRSDTYDFVDFNKGLGKAPVDPNALLVWLSAEYVHTSKDTAFLRAHLATLERAVKYLDKRTKDGLLHQGPYEDWRDLTGREGATLYGNVLYWKAVSSLAELEAKAGRPAEAQRRTAQADALAKKIQKTFWDEEKGYFHDQVGLDVFGGDGNFLAGLTGLATPTQTRSLLAAADRLLLRGNGLYASTDKPYPAKDVPWYLSLAGIRGYGDGTLVWPWMTSLYALAAAKAGDTTRAQRALSAVAQASHRDGTFAEIYDERGQGVRRGVYKSEVDFSWSAGLYLAGLKALREAQAARFR
ncbi:MAG: amylo-alpha-1,6-glucosidase [Myxococcota bacterium]